MATAGFLGGTYENILPMTNTLTVTDATVNIVVGTSGLSGGKALTLPSIAQMVACQNLALHVVNASGSGGTITVGPNAADNTIIGQVAVAVATGVVYRHDGRHTWFGI